MLTPSRRRGFEILDDPHVDPRVRERSMVDVTRSNRWLGGLRAVRLGVKAASAELGRRWTLLDVGTGLADLPEAVRRDARAVGQVVTAIGADEAVTLLATARGRIDLAVAASVLALPFRDASVDLVLCSQLLHHFAPLDIERVLGELNRVASGAVVVSDLRRSWLAAAGFWFAAFILRFHRVTRHDGVTSVMRGFTADELRRHIEGATGVTPVVERRLGYRLVARWSPRAHGA